MSATPGGRVLPAGGVIRAMDASRRQLTGVGSVVVAFGGILLAWVVSPAFTPTAHALSNLGVATTAPGTDLTVLLFNGGLVSAGLLGLAFAWTLFSTGSTGDPAVAGSFALAVVLLGLVGVFPQGTALHFPVALGFYLLVSVTLWLDGLLRLRRGEDALPGLALGTLNIAGWVAWTLTGPLSRPGLALPELLGAAAFGAWVLLRVCRP